MEVVVVPGDIFHSNVWRKNRVEFDAVLVLCRTWFCNHLRHQWGPCPVNLGLPPRKKAFCPSSYGWTELPQTKLRLSGMATCAWSFFDLTKTKPKTEAKTKAKVKTKTNNKVKIKEKTQNLWMPLTMLGGYVSVVADLVERGVVKPRSLLS